MDRQGRRYTGRTEGLAPLHSLEVGEAQVLRLDDDAPGCCHPCPVRTAEIIEWN